MVGSGENRIGGKQERLRGMGFRIFIFRARIERPGCRGGMLKSKSRGGGGGGDTEMLEGKSKSREVGQR